MKSVYISYSMKNVEEAQYLYQLLEDHQISCYIAPSECDTGNDNSEKITNGLEECQAFLLLLTKQSNNSIHVIREVEKAAELRLPMIVVKEGEFLLTKSMSYFLSTDQWIEVKGNISSQKEKLLQSINYLLDEGAATEEIYVKRNSKKKVHRLDGFNRKWRSLFFFSIPVILCLLIFYYLSSEWDRGSIASTLDGLVADAPANNENIDTSVIDVNKVATKSFHSMEVGDLIQFGRYLPDGVSNQEDKIIWIVLEVNHNSGDVLLLSEKILDVKPFDVSESGVFNTNSKGIEYHKEIKDKYSMEEMTSFRGNSDWEYSNIRAWLNSSEAKVTYQDQAPISYATDESANGYEDEPGFLYGFSKEERKTIQTSETVTTVNALQQGDKLKGDKLLNIESGEASYIFDFEGAKVKYTKDKVFLLSLQEVIDYMTVQNIPLYTVPTQAAREADDSHWIKMYQDAETENYFWALRTPDGGSSYNVLAIGCGSKPGIELIKYNAAISSFGIRPALRINLKDSGLAGTGDKNDPYVIGEK